MLLLQILAGTIMAHAYYDRRSFYGLDLHHYLPFNFLRDVHIQAPIIWIGVGWIGAGLFLAPAIAGGREARGQGLLVDLLFWVTLIIVAGALIGNWLGIMGYMGDAWFWFGNQGLSYIQLGRFWQIGFFVGLLIWSALMFRALWPTGPALRQATRQFWSGRIRLENLIWAATLNIAILYVFGMIPLTGIEKSFTITDFWRWWVVHLWVEQSFEFFAASMSAYLLMAVGLVSRRLAERAVYFELILIFLGGVLGTGHHLYWAGGPSMWVPLGSMFSFIEVLPLVLLIIEAIQQHRLIRAQQAFNYRLAYTLYHRRGVLELRRGRGFRRRHAQRAADQLLRARDVSDPEPCPYGAVRGVRPAGDRADLFLSALCRGGPRTVRRAARACGRSGSTIRGWCSGSCSTSSRSAGRSSPPVYEHGFAYARSVAFYDTTLFWQWMRFPGDVVFAAGALLMAWDFLAEGAADPARLCGAVGPRLARRHAVVGGTE